MVQKKSFLLLLSSSIPTEVLLEDCSYDSVAVVLHHQWLGPQPQSSACASQGLAAIITTNDFFYSFCLYTFDIQSSYEHTQKTETCIVHCYG